jgi:flagellar biosynthesis/type III secretory pathway chaperone
MDENTTDPLNDLSDLLDAERAALLEGDLATLTDMLALKESLIGAMAEATAENRPTIQKLDAKVKRNQLLFDGALEGIRQVAQRMSHLRKTNGTLATYGADGQKQNIDVAADRSVERRA